MHWRSRLVQPQTLAPSGFKSLATPTVRGSTVLFDRQADVIDDWSPTDGSYSYGLYGTPTTLELAGRIKQIESATHTFIVPGGQAAIALIYLSFCKSGSHALVPSTAYGPNREMAEKLLSELGIEVEAYPALIGGNIASLIRNNTALIWVESPGSVTMEIQDVPAICAAAHRKGIPVALDNTYSAGVLFDAFAHDVDVSMQALTKYVGGHSDILLGSVSVRDDSLKEKLALTFKLLGLAVSPDDCSLALRGLQTLGVRLAQLEKSTLEIAQWLEGQDAIQTVLHPALKSSPGHEIWLRDFTGSASVFSILFKQHFHQEQVECFVDSLRLFKIGMSWGGVTSLAIVYPNLVRDGVDYAGRLVRLNVGLEEPADLKADLKQALEAMTTKTKHLLTREISA